jgi:hypothetical protein
MGAVPLQLPGEPVSTCPSVGVPLIVGGAEFAGGRAGGATTAVGPELVVAEPAAFDAVTATTIV